MNIHLPSDVMLLPDLRVSGEKSEQIEEIENWLVQLCRSLEEYFRRAYFDLSLGTVRRRVVSSVPNVDDLGEGEIVLYDNTVDTRRLYTKMNGDLRYVALT
jgi:hypothetical protein